MCGYAELVAAEALHSILSNSTALKLQPELVLIGSKKSATGDRCYGLGAVNLDGITENRRLPTAIRPQPRALSQDIGIAAV